MTESLQDQLLKAGLADEKRAREVRKDKQGKKNKPPKGQRGRPQKSEAAERARTEQAAKAERDRQTEAKRQAKRQAKEVAAQIRQIVDTNRVSRAEGETVYRFTQGGKIKELQVTEVQRQQLARGELAVIASAGRYDLVPASVAERIRRLDESAIRVANDRHSNEGEREEDAYADFPVPDDLMW